MLCHRTIPVVLCAFVLFAQLLAHKALYAADNDGRYSIVLAAAPGGDLKWGRPDMPAFEGYTVYVTPATIKNEPWERLCMGFFDTRNQAAAKLDEIRSSYPGAWISETTPAKRRRTLTGGTSRTARSIRVAAKPQHKRPETRTSHGTNLSEAQLESLLLRAETSFKKKDYSQAIRYLTAVTEVGEHKHSAEALELLGLSRQRKSQNAHAAAVYEAYLEKYPDTEGAQRVRQRLAGLITASSAPNEEIRMQSHTSSRLDTFGSFSQHYRNDRALTDDIGNVTVVSQLISFIDATSVVQTLDYDHQFRLISDHVYDWVADEDQSEFRFIEMYYDLHFKRSGSSGRIGRQSLRIGGLLRRYDGISAGYQITPDMRINLLGGFPVDFIDNKTSINQHKTFYGITFETGLFFKHWEMKLFHFEQAYDGLEDGTSTGTEVRYSDRTKSIFGMIDYDTFYKEINAIQFNANLLLNHGITAYLNGFMRKTPFLSVENALIGRTEQSIEELRQNLNIEQIYQLALDRTADSANITIGGTKLLNAKFQANADITFSRVDGTIASGGVPATPDKGTDYLINAQLVGNSVLINRDTAVLGIRYYDTEFVETISFIGNTRFFITRDWRINPRLQYDIRDIVDGRSQNKLRALLRTDYRIRNRARFDFEVGYDDTSEAGNSTSLGNSYLFFTLGYRLDF